MGISWCPRSCLSLTRAPADAIKAPRGLPFTRCRVGAKVLNRRCLAPSSSDRGVSRPGFAPVYTAARSLSLRIRAHASSVFVLGRSRIRLPGPSGDVKLALRGAGVTSGSACGSCDQWLFGLAAVVFAVRSFGTRVAGPRREHFRLQVSSSTASLSPAPAVHPRLPVWHVGLNPTIDRVLQLSSLSWDCVRLRIDLDPLRPFYLGRTSPEREFFGLHQ